MASQFASPLRETRHKLDESSILFPHCPACGDQFRSDDPDSLPILYTCGHSLCFLCSDALDLAGCPRCTVCSVKTAVLGKNIALVELVEAVNNLKIVPTPSPDRVSGQFSEVRSHHCGHNADDDDSVYCKSFDEQFCGECWKDHDLTHPMEPATSAKITLTAEAQKLSSQADNARIAMITTLQRVKDARDSVVACTTAACDKIASFFDSIITAVQARRDAAIKETRELSAARCKSLDAQWDALNATAGQLNAAIAACKVAVVSGHLPSLARVLTDARRMVASLTERCHDDPCEPSVIAVACSKKRVITALDATTCCSVHKSGVTASACIVSGAGASLYNCNVSSDDPASAVVLNDISVTCRNAELQLCPYATPSSVNLQWLNGDGSPLSDPGCVCCDSQISAPGVITFSYKVSSAPVQGLAYRLVVDGKVDTSRLFRLWGCHRSITLEGGNHFGLAVLPGIDSLIVANQNTNLVSFHSLAHSDIKLKSKLYRNALGSAKLRQPFRMCAGPKNHVLIANEAGKNIVEVTPLGELVNKVTLPAFEDAGPACIDYHDGFVVVGRRLGSCPRVIIACWSTLAVTASGGVSGHKEGQLGSCYGVRFSPDGSEVVLAESSRITVMTRDLQFVKRVFGVGAFGTICSDIAFTPAGQLIAVDTSRAQIHTFHYESGTVISSFGCSGFGSGQFRTPTAVCIADDKMYVLEANHPRVQVFV